MRNSMQSLSLTDATKDAILVLNSSSQVHLLWTLRDGILTEKMAIKISELCEDLPYGKQQFVIVDFINGIDMLITEQIATLRKE